MQSKRLTQWTVGSVLMLPMVVNESNVSLQNCNDNFGGPQCLSCKQGYYMDDYTQRCEICACPLPSEGNKSVLLYKRATYLHGTQSRYPMAGP